MTAPKLPSEVEIRARLARHGLTPHGMDAQVRIVLDGLDTLANLDAAWDRYFASMSADSGRMFLDHAPWMDGAS